MRTKKGFLDFISAFPDEQTAIKYFEKIRWGDKVVSPYDPTSKVYKYKDGRYKCRNTGKYFTYKTGTCFANSKLPFRHWLYAIVMLLNHKGGISSYQLARDLGITQKTAWIMLHKIRAVVAVENKQFLSGEVEIDETFVGGKNINRHKDKKVAHCQGRSYADKVPVFGILQRGGKITAHTVNEVDGNTLNNSICQNVKQGSVIYSDGWHYGDLRDYVSREVDHSKHFYGTTYVDKTGEVIVVSTNGIENAWSLFKRSIKGTYIHVSRKHLQKYVDEFVFRYNTRKVGDLERFHLTLRYAV